MFVAFVSLYSCPAAHDLMSRAAPTLTVVCYGTEGRNNGVNERPAYPGTLADVAFKGRVGGSCAEIGCDDHTVTATLPTHSARSKLVGGG